VPGAAVSSIFIKSSVLFTLLDLPLNDISTTYAYCFLLLKYKQTPTNNETNTKIDAKTIIVVRMLPSSSIDVDRIAEFLLLLPLVNIILLIVGVGVEADLVVDELLPPVFVLGLSFSQEILHLLLQHIKPRSQLL